MLVYFVNYTIKYCNYEFDDLLSYSMVLFK